MNRKPLSTTFAAALFVTSLASAQGVTGDFKVTGIGYTNDVATVSGSVNHGAIQSGKNVVVDLTYEYSFVAEMEEVIPGETTTVSVHIPGRCVTGVPNTNGCFHPQTGEPLGIDDEKWVGHYEVSSITTDPQTITHTFNGVQGMTAITEPTVERGRLNPKGKITGYNWQATMSIVPNAGLVDPALVPMGYTVVSVTINSVSYAAYLVDPAGNAIPDTVTGGVIH